MCTIEISRPSQPIHRSIIKKIKSNDSCESDYISVDDINQQNSSISSLNTDEPACSQDNINIPTNTSCNNNSPSLENVIQKSESFSSESPYIQNCRTVEQLPRSQSLDSLSFSPLRETTTNDSGTGDSVVHLAAETPVEPLHYDIVPVLGQPMLVLMANRYDFDPAKVADYKIRKRPIIGPIFGKPPRPTPETTPKSIKRNSSESKKSPNIISRFLKPFKNTTTEQTTFTPMVRHHSSHNISDKND